MPAFPTSRTTIGHSQKTVTFECKSKLELFSSEMGAAATWDFTQENIWYTCKAIAVIVAGKHCLIYIGKCKQVYIAFSATANRDHPDEALLCSHT